MKNSEVCNVQAHSWLGTWEEKVYFQQSTTFRPFKEGSIKGKKNQDNVNNTNIEEIVKDLPPLSCCLFLRSTQMVSWMNVRVTTLTCTVLPAIKFCDFLCARYNITPPPPLTLKKMW